MVKKATMGVLMMLLLFGLFLNWPSAKAQTASPSEATVTVSGVPAGTKGLAVEVTVDTMIITLGAVAADFGGLAFSDSNSAGVGLISETDIPASFMLTIGLNGVAEGTSMFSVGMVLNMLGGTEITGATAAVASGDTVTVTGAAPTPTPSSSPTGAGGMLSADTFSVTINGAAVNETNALNVTIAISDPTVVELDTAKPTFMGTGATLLLSDAANNVLTVAWDGAITDSSATITAMLKPGTMAGTAMISVTKVEQAGANDVTANVDVVVSPDTITNSGGGEAGGATFSLIAPDEVTGPGKLAVGVSVDGTAPSSATINGKMVDFVDDNVGIAIVDVPASGPLDLMLTAGGDTVDLGSISVTAGSGKAPKVTKASASNKSSGTKLTVKGKNFSSDGTTVEIVPTDRATSADPTVKKLSIKATYDASECIPKGSYINVSTAGGTAARKLKVRGSCDNALLE